MSKLFLTFFALIIALGTKAQKLTVDFFKASPKDISASQSRRVDLNGKPCALIKVQLLTQDIVFEGNVVKPVEYKGGEYWVYMTDGSRELRINHQVAKPEFVPLHVTFAEYGIDRVQSLSTYELNLIIESGFPKDAETAEQLAQLGRDYELGRNGKKKSDANAVKWYQKAADLGNAIAQYYLGEMYAKGRGVAQNDIEALKWYRRSAEQGYDIAQYNIGIYYKEGKCVPTDLEQAQHWFQNAAAQGNKNAKKEYDAISQLISSENAESQYTQSFVNDLTNSSIETITVNGVSFNMINVEGGTFMMGSDDSNAWENEKPVHQVTLSTYSIGETEVTCELWNAVMGDYTRPSMKNLPYSFASWDDCQKFIAKLNQLTNRNFRLPTEAEWEFAARGGNKSQGYKFSGGNRMSTVGWYKANSGGKTHDVKMKKPNELGLYDMSGNASEWCQDWYDTYNSEPQTNPTGPSNGKYRVQRGSSWVCHGGKYIPRLTKRYGRDPKEDRSSYNTFDFGLRLAL